MDTRTIAIFFYEDFSKNGKPIDRMSVAWIYWDDEMTEILEEQGRYRVKNMTLKKQNMLLLQLPGKQITDIVHKANHICDCIKEQYHPFKPISHLKLNDHPEWLV